MVAVDWSPALWASPWQLACQLLADMQHGGHKVLTGGQSRWTKQEEVVQVVQEGRYIVVLQDPMEGTAKLIEDARDGTEAKRKAGVNIILTTLVHA